MTQESQTSALWQPGGWDMVEGSREVQDGRDICITMVDLY